MKKLTIELKHNMAEALVQLLSQYIEMNYIDADDKLVIAVLAEFKIALMRRLIQPKHKYRITLTPATAIALQIFNDGFIDDYSTQVGNKLHQIGNQVKQQYQ